jgi:hypothetical protein
MNMGVELTALQDSALKSLEYVLRIDSARLDDNSVICLFIHLIF